MNKKRALSILMAAAMAAGTLVTSVPVYADDVEEMSLIVSTKSTMANIT